MELLLAVLDALPSGVLVVDHRGIIKLVNRQLAESFGYQEGELVGETLEVLLPRTIRDRHEGLRASYCEAPEERMMGAGRELYAVKKDGSFFPVEIGLRPFPHNGANYVAASVVDITQRRAMEAQAEEAYSDLQQLTYGVSHDLKAPMRSIAGFVQILKTAYSGHLPEEAHELIDRTVQAVEALQNHINQLLTLATIDGQASRFVSVRLNDVLESVLYLLGDSIPALRESVSWSNLPTVLGDHALLVQLFQNLISNAVKYAHPERPAKVTIRATSDGEHWIIDVTDNGLGIPEEHQERVFQVFERVHGSNYPGSGIGLATCRRVAKRLGGEIELAHSSTGGSTFRVRLRKKEG